MKNFYTVLLSAIFWFQSPIISQTLPIENIPQNAKSRFVHNKDYLSPTSDKYKNLSFSDSLAEFDENRIKAELLSRGVYGAEYLNFLPLVKRDYVDRKFKIGPYSPTWPASTHGSTPAGSKFTGSGSVINVAPCVNEGFEATPLGQYTASTAVTGWTVESGMNTTSIYSQLGNTVYGAACNANAIPTWSAGSPEFWVVQTPITSVAALGTLPNSPLGGSRVVQLNNTSPTGLMTRIRSSFPVTTANTLFQFAYAGSWDGVHDCCGQPAFRVDMYQQPCTGGTATLVPCASVSLTPSGSQCPIGVTGYSMTGTVRWTNWQVRYIDLTPYIGSCVTIQITNADCAYYGHYGQAFFDARCGSGLSSCDGMIPGPVSFCAGSNQATIAGPLGYATYSWVPPVNAAPLSSAQATLATVTITNPVANSIYTLYMQAASGCQFTYTTVILPTTVNISALCSTSSCIGGASGSATVQGNGSATGYNYNWINAANNTTISSGSISNNSISVSGLAPGVYSVVMSAPGCGSAVATTTITQGPPGITTIIKPYCGTEAYLSLPGGSNYQWYYGSTPITGSLGTASSYTVNNPINQSIWWLGYLSPFGCRDSVRFILNSSAAGSLSTPSVSQVCPGASNGTAFLSLTPAVNAPSGQNYWHVFSTGSTSAYSSSVNPTSANQYTAYNLSQGTYSVKAFDGACKYSLTFTVNTTTLSILSLVSSTTCSGGSSGTATVQATGSGNNGYNYVWINASNNLTILSSSATVGTTTVGGLSAGIYSVVVTAPGAPGCGSLAATTTVTQGSPGILEISKQYCGTDAYLSMPGGSNYQWYNNLTPITGSIGSAPSYTVLNAINQSVWRLGYLSPFGCRDSVKFILTSSSPGTLGTATVNYVCPNMNNGSAIISMTPAPYASTGQNYWKIVSTGTTPVFSSSISLTSANQYSISNLPMGTYSVQAFDGACKYASTFTVNAIPIITANNGTVCSGQSYTLSASGANSYTYSSGSAVVSPFSTTTYTITGPGATGCLGNTVAVTVTVLTSPTISINNGTICAGQAFTLTPSGASNYTFSGGLQIVSPTVTSSYTVSGSNNFGCKNSSISTVTVFPLPIVTVNSGTICSGESFTIIPSGANTYTYSSGLSVVSPTSNSTYTITGTNSFGCRSISSIATVTVYSKPIITANSGSICSGNSFTFFPSGANSYTYSAGTPVVTPSINSSYTITGTSLQGCQGLGAIATVTVHTLPNITISNGTICSGQSYTLSPSGAQTYSFSSGTPIVSPLASTSYSVSGISAEGCVGNVAVSTVTVYPIPLISINSGTICSGQSFTFNPTGANTYTFQNGSNVVTPTATSSYSVVGMDNSGCISAVAISTVLVNPNPTMTVNSGSICSGQTYTITASGANSYTIQGGSSIVNPVSTTVYSVAGTNSAGCSSSTIACTITVVPTPTLVVNNQAICIRESRTLTASGATTYTWNTNATTPSIVVSPNTTTTYTVTGSTNNCAKSQTVQVKVSPCTSIDEMEAVGHLKILPNPNNGEFTIESDNDMKLRITDQLGRFVAEIEVKKGTNQFRIENLTRGIYFFTGQNNVKVYSGKMVIN